MADIIISLSLEMHKDEDLEKDNYTAWSWPPALPQGKMAPVA